MLDVTVSLDVYLTDEQSFLLDQADGYKYRVTFVKAITYLPTGQPGLREYRCHGSQAVQARQG